MIGHIAIGIAEVECDRIERRAQCAARRLLAMANQDASKPLSGKNARIGATPFSATPPPRQQVRQPGLATKIARDIDQYVFQHLLDTGGAIGKAAAVRSGQVDGIERIPADRTG